MPNNSEERIQADGRAHRPTLSRDPRVAPAGRVRQAGQDNPASAYSRVSQAPVQQGAYVPASYGAASQYSRNSGSYAGRGKGGSRGKKILVAVIIIALIATATVCTIAVFRKRRAAEQDVAGMRMKRAVRMAHKRLKKAEGHLKGGDTGRFYEEIYRAIWGCLADKYNIPLAELNRDTVSECLTDRQVPEKQQQNIMQVLQDVDMARFAPIDPEAQKHKIYDEALQMIASI